MDLSNENIIHVRKENIEYLQFKKLLEYGITNCFTLKGNGIDFNKNSSFNNPENVENSYLKICSALEIDRDTIIRPGQSHTDNIEAVKNASEMFIDVDGLLTNTPNINLVLGYADCTPILLYDTKNKIVGNIHSGWRGTVQKIGQKAVLKMMNEFYSKPEDIIVCIGPCIGRCHFEVEERVKDIFDHTFSYLNKNCDIIEKSKKDDGKYFIDTTLINKLILEEVGILKSNIFESGICTVCNSNIIHSYRAEKEKSGRNIAIIGLR